MKNPDWFSRKHKTNAAHYAAKERKRLRIRAWADRMARNEQERADRGLYGQLKMLDLRLGVGKGAKRERKRLLKQLI